MRARITVIRLAVAVAVFYASFALFTQTLVYTVLEEKLAHLLPGIQFGTILLVVLANAVLLTCLLSGEWSSHAIYGLSIALYLLAVFSLPGISWYWWRIFGLPTEAGTTPLFGPILLVGLAIVACYMLLLSTSWSEHAWKKLVERGGDDKEIGTAISKQLTISAAVVSISVLAAVVASLLVSFQWPENALSQLPDPQLVLGLCGALLVLLSVSFYLLAVKRQRGLSTKTK